MTSTMHTHMEVAGQTPASRAPRAHATWQGADLLAPSEFESFLDDYLMSTVEGGGAVPGEHGGTKQLRQRQQEQRRQGPAAQLRSNPLTSRSAPDVNAGLPSLPLSPGADGAGSRAPSGEAAHTALRSSSGDSAGPSSPPRKGGGGKSSAAKRTLELQEKNRRAQRRFRERQKAKVSELEQQVDELAQRITLLSTEKANLDSRVNILVRVLRMRDEEVAQLQQKLKVSSSLEEADLVAGMEDLKLTSKGGRPLTLTPEQLRTMTREQLIGIWKDYVNQLAALLLELERGDNPSAADTIKQYIEEVSMLSMRMHLINPSATRQFLSARLEDESVSPGEVETAERWLNVARSLGLSEAQRTEIIQLRRLFLTKMGNITKQRRDIHETMMSAMPAPSFSRETAIRSLRTHDSMALLRANLKEEHILKMDWILTLFKHTLTPPQVARLLVQAWPWSPDTLAMATWVAAEAGEHDALATLTQASRGLLVSQPLQPAGQLPGSNGPLGGPQLGSGPGSPLGQQHQQPGFDGGSGGGGGIAVVKSEPLAIWRPGENLPQFPGSSDGMDMNPQGASPELPSFDLGTSLDALGDFDPNMPIGSLEMPTAHHF